jgi:hypothetical protein
LKNLITISIVLFKFNSIFCQNLISIDSLSSNLNKVVTICDSVASYNISKGKAPNIYISLGKPFPDQKLSIVIFTDSKDTFSYIPPQYLLNRKVCVTGKLTECKGRKQIIWNRETRIKVRDN